MIFGVGRVHDFLCRFVVGDRCRHDVGIFVADSSEIECLVADFVGESLGCFLAVHILNDDRRRLAGLSCELRLLGRCC